MHYFSTIGSQDGTLHVWSIETGEEIVILDGGHPTPTHCVQFNPKYLMLSSAGRSLVSSVYPHTHTHTHTHTCSAVHASFPYMQCCVHMYLTNTIHVYSIHERRVSPA